MEKDFEEVYEKLSPMLERKAERASRKDKQYYDDFLSEFRFTLYRVWKSELRDAKFETVLYSALRNREASMVKKLSKVKSRSVPEEIRNKMDEDGFAKTRFDIMRLEDFDPPPSEIAETQIKKDDIRQDIARMSANSSDFEKSLLKLLTCDDYFIESTNRINKESLALALSCSRKKIDNALKRLRVTAKSYGMHEYVS